MKYMVLVLTLCLALSASGPSDFEKEKLAFEKQKYADEQAGKAEAARKDEEDKTEQKRQWSACRLAASDDYNNEWKSWGEPSPGKPGIRSGPANQLQEIKNRLQRKNEQCDRNFPRGINW